jgi:hypothetical protein
MTSIDGRVSKLEHRFGVAGSAIIFLVILIEGGGGTAADAYLQILDEAGFFPASGSYMVDFSVIPSGLNAKEVEKFVRENGARICGTCRLQGPGEPGNPSRPT